MTREELLMFGERVCKARKKSHYTQEHVSTTAKKSLRFYQMLERGEKGPSLDTAMQLSKALNVSLDYLLFGDLGLDLSAPTAEMLSQMTPRQKENVIKIVQLYLEGCQSTQNNKNRCEE